MSPPSQSFHGVEGPVVTGTWSLRASRIGQNAFLGTRCTQGEMPPLTGRIASVDKRATVAA